jgi:hypothetical protein
MNTLKNSFLLFITLFFFSCNSFVHKNKESYELRATDEYLKFPLNSKTSLLIKAIYPFVDKDETEYLTFQNNMEPEILVYNMKKQTYVRTISFNTLYFINFSIYAYGIYWASVVHSSNYQSYAWKQSS